jgi:LPXTG-motif cell wall-anchored protein
MGLRTTVVATVVAAALSFPMAGVAAAQTLTCGSFTTQAAAQAAYNSNTRDPYDLDRDNDGQACEALPGQAPGTGEGPNPNTGVTPTRGVETGAGGTADLAIGAEDTEGDDSGSLLPLVVGGAMLAAGGLVLARRRSARKGD